jgi:hypothetical protein
MVGGGNGVSEVEVLIRVDEPLAGDKQIGLIVVEESVTGGGGMATVEKDVANSQNQSDESEGDKLKVPPRRPGARLRFLE